MKFEISKERIEQKEPTGAELWAIIRRIILELDEPGKCATLIPYNPVSFKANFYKRLRHKDFVTYDKAKFSFRYSDGTSIQSADKRLNAEIKIRREFDRVESIKNKCK